MKVIFVAKVIGLDQGNTYKVEVNSSNINMLPDDSPTTRLVNSDVPLPSGYIYVYDADIEDRVVTINKFGSISIQIPTVVPSISPLLSESIRKMIQDGSVYPADLLGR